MSGGKQFSIGQPKAVSAGIPFETTPEQREANLNIATTIGKALKDNGAADLLQKTLVDQGFTLDESVTVEVSQAKNTETLRVVVHCFAHRTEKTK
jgi:hypothetical protein